MQLLGAKLYDPNPAVSLGTAASAMAVFDTTNARISFTAPPSGYVRVVISCTIHGATTFSQILLGVLEGATVKGKVTPQVTLNGTALATTMMRARADFIVPGLTPGASLTWDAAWGIETFVASSLIKYGGPANATANNDFGALQFEIWDPAPSSIIADAVWDEALSGHATAGSAGAQLSAAGAAGDPWATALPGAYSAGQAGKIIGDNINATISSRSTITTAQVNTEADTALADVGLTSTVTGRIDAAVSSRMATYTQPTGFLAATFPATVASTTNITGGTITTVTNLTNAPTAGDFTATMKTSLNAATPAVTVSDKTGFSLSAAANNAIRDTILTDATRFAGANLDATISSRLPTSSYTAPLTAATTRSALGLATANLDSQLSTIDTDVLARLATSGYTAPDNASITSIKAKTDSLTFSVANRVDSNIRNVNNTAVNGLGTAGNPWGP